MTTYTIPTRFVSQTWQARAKVFLFNAVLIFFLYLGLSSIFRYSAIMRNSRSEQILTATFYAVIFGLTATYRYCRPRKATPSTLMVDGDSITGVSYIAGWKWPVVNRTIHRDKVKTLWEIKGPRGAAGGIAVSEASKLRARLFSGFLIIPSSLDNYEELKSLVEGWHDANVHPAGV